MDLICYPVCDSSNARAQSSIWAADMRVLPKASLGTLLKDLREVKALARLLMHRLAYVISTVFSCASLFKLNKDSK